MRPIVSLMLVLAGLSVGCGDDAGDDNGAASAQLADAGAGKADATVPCVDDKTASALIEARSANTTLKGTVHIAKDGDTTKLTLTVTGAPPGPRATHIHMTGDCSAPDATSAGGHWNPEMHPHGDLSAGPAHLGDLGNFTVGEDGKGTLEVSNAEWTIGDGALTDVVGKAIIVHAGVDDFTTQPTGNAGGRIGCGVITLD